MNIELIDHLSSYEDERGQVITYLPKDPLVEMNIIHTKEGETRGFHYHPEYDEYMIITSGEGTVTEYSDDGEHINTITTPTGSVVRIPKNIKHSSKAITDYTFINLLTKTWDDCENAILPMENTAWKF